ARQVVAVELGRGHARSLGRLGRPVALVGDRDHAFPQPEGEKHLGGTRDEGADAHLTTLAKAGYPHRGRRSQPHWKTQGASIVMERPSGKSERVKHDSPDI